MAMAFGGDATPLAKLAGVALARRPGTVIGWTLPFGMVLVGVTAELLGARLALVASSVVGLTLLAASLNRYPHVLDQVASTYPGVQPVSVMAPTRISDFSESPAS
jgi:hypothetical protein